MTDTKDKKSDYRKTFKQLNQAIEANEIWENWKKSASEPAIRKAVIRRVSVGSNHRDDFN